MHNGQGMRTDVASPARAGPKDATLIRSLGATELFAGLSDEQLRVVARSASRKRCTRGESIHRQGERATKLTVVVSGLVKLSRRTEDDGCSILGIYGPRESLGTAVALRGEPYIGTATALTEGVEIIRVEAGPLLAAADVDLGVARAVRRALLTHASLLERKVEVMSAGGVARRLALLLLSLSDHFGDELADGALSVAVPLSRVELASFVGARPETTIRVLSAWQRSGWLRTVDGRLEIASPDALRAFIGGHDECGGHREQRHEIRSSPLHRDLGDHAGL